MPDTATTVHVEAESDFGRLLDTAAESDILLEEDGVHFRLYRAEAPTPSGADQPPRRLKPERMLNIIGLGASEHECDIARQKDRYIADAADRGE